MSRRLSNLINNPPQPGSGADVPNDLRNLDARREELETTLAARSKDFARYQASRKLTPVDIQKLLPADAVLVAFLVYGDRVELAADFRGELSLIHGPGDSVYSVFARTSFRLRINA